MNGPIDRGQRVVVSRVGLVALFFQASQHRLERFGVVIGHQAPVRLPAAAVAVAIRPSTGLLADANSRFGIRPAL